MKPPRYEYEADYHSSCASIQVKLQLVNQMAKDGWELVCVATHAPYDWFYFKRLVKPIRK